MSDVADKQAEEIVKQLATVVGRFGALAQPVSNQIVAAALREAQAKIANLKAEAVSNHSLLNDVQAEQAAERQREKDAEIAGNLCQSWACMKVTGTDGFCIACQVRNAILVQEKK